MPRHFSSVLRIVSNQQQQQSSDTSTLTICGDGKSVELPKQHAEKPFTFDRVYFAADDNSSVYKGSVKEIVEGSLLGYNGTIISTGESGLKFGDTLASSAKRSPGVILKATDHIFVCIKRSRSRTGSSLVVLCSYLAVVKEKVYDLLRNYGNEAQNSGDFPVVSCKQGQLLGRAAFQAKNPAAIRKFLSHGEDVLTKIKAELFPGQDNNTQWHTIFMITVEHAQFGAQFAPVSGTLSFVQLSTCTTEDDSSYGSFVAVIDQLASTKLDLNSVNKQPEYSKSVLTEILRESLGGNCRTVLISHVNFALHFPDRALQVLETGSKACSVHNQPNKRDLAEQALMSAYMKELRQIYGDVVMAVEENPPGNTSLQPPTPPVPKDGSTTVLNAASRTSVLTTEIDDTYDELIKDLQPASGGSNSGTTVPKRFVEMAANALAEAALEGDSEDSEADDTEEDASNTNLTTNDEPCSSKTLIGGSSKGKGAAKRQGSGDSRSAASHNDGDIPESERLMMTLAADGFSGVNTSIYEALAAILQDPDRGAHRVQDRKDIKIRKDVGALFSGADIVQWMMESLAGLKTSEEAEKLGQLLLDQGAILHSEGSSIFANAKSLFYYVHRPRAAGKMLSREEIAALLAQASGDTNQTSITVVEHFSTSPVTILNKEGDTTTTSVVENIGDSSFSTEEVALPEDKGVLLPVEDIGSSDTLKVSNNAEDDKLSDVVVLPVEPEDQEVDQDEDGVIVIGDLDQQQEVDDVVTEQIEPTAQQEINQQEVEHMSEDHVTEQQEVNHITGQQDRTKSTPMLPSGSSSSVGSKMRKHKSVTSKSSKAKMKAQVSMLEELNRQLQGADTSSSSVAVNTGGAAFWSRGVVQPEDGSGWSHEPSKSSGLHQTLGIQEYDEDKEENEEEPLPEEVPSNRLSYSEVPNVTTTTGIEELQEINDIEAYPTPLHMSAALGKKEGVISNLSMMYGVNNEDFNGRTPLMYAAIKNKVRSCQALIKCGAKIDQADHMGTTALHYAAYLGYCNVISLLLSKGAAPLLRDCQGQTALHLATVVNATETIQTMLKSSMELTKEEDNHRLTPIHWAVAFDHVEQLKILIKGIPDPEGLDSCGRSLLNYSICCNAIKCMRTLLSLHPLLMDVTDSSGHLPIHVASMQDSATPLNILLQEDANKQKQPVHLNATDGEGKTALHWSVTYSQLDNTEVLLRHGASTDVVDEEGLTPLDICKQNGKDGIEILQLLQEGIQDTIHIEDKGLQRRQKSRSKFCLLL